jgi:hypothetical protein
LISMPIAPGILFVPQPMSSTLLGQESEDRRQESEDGRQESEDGRQESEDGRQESEDT